MPSLDLSPNPVSLNFLYATTSAVNALTSFALGLFILLKNPRSKLHQLWWWMSLSITLWAVGLSVSFGTAPYNYDISLFAVRFADMVAIFIPMFYLHFIVAFLGRSDQQRMLRICYSLSILLACFAFTPSYIPGLKTKLGIVNYNDAGPLFGIFLALYLWETTHAIRLMWQARQKTVGVRKAHITYVMAAGVLGFLVGATFFPLCFRISIPPVGGHVVWLYCIFVAWAVFKYRLFDIQVVIRKSLVYSILITLLTAGYFGLVYAIEWTFRATFGYQSVWLSLAAFALMTMAFQPLKIWVQRGVDWLIFRAPQEAVVKRMERLEQEAQQTEKFKAVSTLAAGMAHEIKNPLTAIKAFSESVPELHNDSNFMKQYTAMMPEEISRIQRIVQDLLNFAKPKSPELKPLEMVPLIHSTVSLLSSELSKRHIHWTVTCQHNGATPQADADQIRQVLINLVQNAAEAMPDGGTLIITTQTNDGHLELKVSDTGQGIPKELLHKIFDPFVTTKEGGNGLGLAMVYSIVQAHRGTIIADSTPGHGTTFTIRIPL